MSKKDKGSKTLSILVGCSVVALQLGLTGSALAEQSYSPYVEQKFPSSVYFGDTHLHTNMSVDANGMGNRALTPDDAYRFARGGAVMGHNGQMAQLERPLDFLVVADHAINMGVMPALAISDPALLKTELGKKWHEKFIKSPLDTTELLTSETDEKLRKASASIFGGNDAAFFWQSWKNTFGSGDKAQQLGDDAFRQRVWNTVVGNAEKYNQPGVFTAFVGYEWTANEPAAIHRVVVFKEGEGTANKVIPFSNYDSPKPEDLWAYMASYEANTEGEILAIPHNSNLTNGVMFALEDSEGHPLSKDYAELRARWEPLVEATQIKGDSETHPILSPDDEFADYETWNSWDGWTMKGVDKPGWKKRKEFEYVRSALKHGLGQQARLGANPFKFGMIGSTDAHTSLAAVAENNFWGKTSYYEPTPFRSVKTKKGKKVPASNHAASGYAAVWAQENTRDSIFAAMKRKETYATTGPRMTVRFFGGWGYDKDDAFRPNLAEIGYAGGVPMGGDLTSAPKGKAPSFLIRAVKDAVGANLDRVQVIKGWRDKKGKLHEKIYNVALSDSRRDRGKKTRSVGNTVNVADASYTNTIGATELATVWRDPDFKASELAFYYVRVLEIPTPRWNAYDAKIFGVTQPEGMPLMGQERAYTSPIWYTP